FLPPALARQLDYLRRQEAALSRLRAELSSPPPPPPPPPVIRAVASSLLPGAAASAQLEFLSFDDGALALEAAASSGASAEDVGMYGRDFDPTR
ncbi:hypothetical protein HK405_008699, partial [Cladochytrium tenue]